MNRDLKELFKKLTEKPIAFYSIYSKITSSTTAGLLLSQLVYWDRQMNHQEFWKTDEELCQELCMGFYELRGAKTKLTKLKFISTERKGVPATTFYKINIDEIIHTILRLGKNPNLDWGKTQDLIGEKPNTIVSETTSESTSEKDSLQNPVRVSKETRIGTPGFFDVTDESKLGASAVKEVLEIWNSIGLTKHKLNKNSSTIKKTKEYITGLLNGTLCEGRMDVLEPFFASEGIPYNWKNRKWTVEEIIEGIDLLRIVYLDGYWPENKKRLPTDLYRFIYNSRTGFSWFFHLKKHPPNFLKNTREINISKEIQPLVRLFEDEGMVPTKNTPPTILIQTVDRIQGIVDYHKKMRFPHETIQNKIGTPLKFCQHFTWWLKDQRWIDSPETINIGTDAKLFQMFIEALTKEFYGYEIRPKT